MLRMSTPARTLHPRPKSAKTSTVANLEDSVPDKSRSFGAFEYKGPGFSRGWHYHPEIELILFLESTGPLFAGDYIGTYGPGEVLLFGPDLPHELRYVDGPVECVWLHFSYEWFIDTFGTLPETRSAQRFLSQARTGLRFGRKSTTAVTSKLCQMPSLTGVESLIGFLEIIDQLSRASDYISLSSRELQPVIDKNTAARIQIIHEYVFLNFRHHIEHDEIARLVGLKQSALCHFFRRTTGRTITDFINEVRIGHACRMLVTSTLNISEIAYKSGFETHSHFNDIFRRLKKVNPKTFRQKHAGVYNHPSMGI